MDLAPIYVRQIVQHAAKMCVKLDPLIVEEPQHIMDRALGARYRGLKLYFAGAGPWRSQRPHNSAEVVRREGLEKDFLAT